MPGRCPDRTHRISGDARGTNAAYGSRRGPQRGRGHVVGFCGGLELSVEEVQLIAVLAGDIELALAEDTYDHDRCRLLLRHGQRPGWSGPDRRGPPGGPGGTDKALAGLDGPHPESVMVTAVHGFPVEELIKAASDADMIVLGSRVRADSPGC